jgi:hypothetical protein
MKEDLVAEVLIVVGICSKQGFKLKNHFVLLMNRSHFE